MVRPWTLTTAPGRIALGGELRASSAPDLWRAMEEVTAAPRGSLEIDLHEVGDLDGTVTALLVGQRDALSARGVTVRFTGASKNVAELLHLYGAEHIHAAAAKRPRRSVVARVGDGSATVGQHVRRTIEFFGELARGAPHAVSLGGWRDLAPQLARAGTDGIPIVLVLDFLVGFIMAYQSTRQLQTYGANLYVADIVGISMTRELAPLITAIIITGRSGAGFAAELGTMGVGDELDALRTMGIPPVPYLVLPRVVALALAAPVLALLGDIAGVSGGLVVGALSLDVHPHAYLSELARVIVPWDVWTGLLKSLVFGIAIALIGCKQGLTTRGAAAGVGRSTTRTVVACLFALVAIDTLMTMFFREVHA